MKTEGLLQQLAEGWGWSTVGDIFFEIKNGTTSTQNKEGRGVPVSRIETIQNAQFDLQRLGYVQDASQEVIRTFQYHNGDIALSHINSLEHVGKTALYRGEPKVLLHGMNLLRLRLGHRNLHPDFLYCAMQASTFREEVRGRVGRAVNQVSINQKNLSEVPVPIAPLTEQPRIVAKLSELSAHVNFARNHLSRVPAILKRFRQAVLAAACSGRLTEDWRTENQTFESASQLVARIRQHHSTEGFGHGGQAAPPTEGVHDLTPDGLPDSWTVEELRFLCQPGKPITYGILKPGPDTPDGVPYVRVADFPKNCLKLDGIRRTNPQIAKMYRRSILQNGDLLLSIRGTAGRVCRVPTELDGGNITQDTARLSIHPEICTDYVEIYLRCPSAQKRLERAMKGVAVRGVNIGDVRVLQVALPPEEEQAEIAQRVNQLFKIAQIIEDHLTKASANAERITQSILAKAFRGELVPTEAELARHEGREYEPASVLLERIRAERSNQAKSQPASKRKFKKSTVLVGA